MHEHDVHSAVRKRLGLVALGLASYVFALTVVGSLLAKTLLDGESSVLTNPVIDFVRTGVWHYPLHAQDIFFPGVRPFMIHPPLHYVLASLVVKLFGVGTWQLIAISAIVAIVGMLLAAYVSLRIWGVATPLVALAIAASLYGFFYSADQLRCDITFGFVYGLFLLVFGRVVLLELTKSSLRRHSFLIGLLAVGTLAAHWYGYFVQLYVLAYLVLLLRRRRDVLVNAALVIAGAIVAFIPWALLYGWDLWKALIFALVQGDQFRTTIHNTMSYFLLVVSTWPGGRILEVGIFLAAATVAVRLWLAGRRYGRPGLRLRNLPLGLAADAYLLVNLAAYLLWFAIFVGNKAPQYGGDLYFFVIPLAARGYVSTLELAGEVVRRRGAVLAVAGALAAVFFATSSLVHDSFKVNPASLQSSDRVYDAVRSDLTAFVPPKLRVMMGVSAYPYLYDRQFASPMRLVGSYFLKPKRHASFFSILSAALRQRKHFDPASEPPSWLASHLAQAAPVSVTNDDGEGWQYVLYDPRVWGPSFTQVAAVIVNKPKLATTIPFVPTAPPLAQLFVVYVRKDALASYRTHVRLAPNALSVGKRVSVLTFAAGGDSADPVDPGVWQKLSEAKRRAALARYLGAHRWFGLPAARHARVSAAIFPTVDALLATSSTALGFERTLGQCVVRALIQTEEIEAWKA